MGAIIIKVDRDRDLYMRWSSVTDTPTHLGTRAEMAELLLEGYPYRDVKSGDAAGCIEETLTRCDETGTTSRIGRPAIGAFDSTSAMIYQSAAGTCLLPRSAIPRLADQWLDYPDDTPIDLDPLVHDLLTD